MSDDKLSGVGMVQLPADAVEVAREKIVMATWLLGPESRAAAVLEKADEHDGPVRFWYSPSMQTLNVELLQDEKKHDA
jgi:hypothetical protein